MQEAGKRGFGLPLVILGVGGIAAAGILFLFDPTRYHFYPLCVFHSTTGLLCPGCGSLRALHALLHGRVVAAFRFNSLLLVCLPFLAWFGAVSAWRTWKGAPPGPKWHSAWIWAFLAVAVLFGILRNLPGEPFSLLRP